MRAGHREDESAERLEPVGEGKCSEIQVQAGEEDFEELGPVEGRPHVGIGGRQLEEEGCH